MAAADMEDGLVTGNYDLAMIERQLSRTATVAPLRPDLGHYSMVMIMLRTAFIVYVRVLLCLQGVCLLLLAGTTAFRSSGIAPGDLLVLALIAALLGLAAIAAAALLGPGRRRAAVTAIAIEGLWTVAACALMLAALREAADTFENTRGGVQLPPLWLFALTVLLLVTTAGLLLRPVRAYGGLVRR